jgi:hypothetical protein
MRHNQTHEYYCIVISQIDTFDWMKEVIMSDIPDISRTVQFELVFRTKYNESLLQTDSENYKFHRDYIESIVAISLKEASYFPQTLTITTENIEFAKSEFKDSTAVFIKVSFSGKNQFISERQIEHLVVNSISEAIGKS